jgi:hypothetical protein
MTFRISLQQFGHGLCYRTRIVKWDNSASPIREQFFRVPVWSGNDRFPGAYRYGERAGNNLRLLPVRRDVYIRSANVFNQFLCAHKAIVKDQLRRYTKRE